MNNNDDFKKAAHHHMLECARQDPVIIKNRPLPAHMTRVHRVTSTGHMYDDIEYDDALEGKLEQHREEDRSYRREQREKKGGDGE